MPYINCVEKERYDDVVSVLQRTIEERDNLKVALNKSTLDVAFQKSLRADTSKRAIECVEQLQEDLIEAQADRDKFKDMAKKFKSAYDRKRALAKKYFEQAAHLLREQDEVCKNTEELEKLYKENAMLARDNAILCETLAEILPLVIRVGAPKKKRDVRAKPEQSQRHAEGVAKKRSFKKKEK